MLRGFVRTVSALLGLLMMVSLPISAVGEADEPIEVGSRIEMLVDEALVAEMEGLSFRLNAPVDCGIAIEKDKPWEGLGSFAYSSVIELDGRYILYYRASQTSSQSSADPGQYLCVAFSDDGETWIKPELEIVPYGQYERTNILMDGTTWGVVCHNFTPMLDTNPDCPREERVKAVGGYGEEGLFVFCSEDGLHFRKFCEEPAVTDRLLDSQNVLVYDSAAGLYRIYSRYFPFFEGASHDSWNGNGVRAIESCTSPDCIHWTLPEPNEYTNGEPREDLYTNATIACPGAEHILISLPMRFSPTRTKGLMRNGPGISDAVFMTSRDGHLWDRRFSESWVDGGFDQKRWTQRNNMPARGLVVKDDCFYAYVLAHYYWDDACLHRYSVRKWGFASLHAGDEVGYFETPPVIFSGKYLKINYKTTAFGGIRAAILDPETGEPFEGFGIEDCREIFGNSIFESLSFQGGNLASLEGKPVVVRFELRQADLFAWKFE